MIGAIEKIPEFENLIKIHNKIQNVKKLQEANATSIGDLRGKFGKLKEDLHRVQTDQSAALHRFMLDKAPKKITQIDSNK
jgi:hypothetical protein